jgi:uridine nucleosidase
VKHTSSAAQFIAEFVRDHPGDVSILALGPLTNIALAMKHDSSMAQNVVSELAVHPLCFACIRPYMWLELTGRAIEGCT